MTQEPSASAPASAYLLSDEVKKIIEEGLSGALYEGYMELEEAELVRAAISAPVKTAQELYTEIIMEGTWLYSRNMIRGLAFAWATALTTIAGRFGLTDKIALDRVVKGELREREGR